jgi:UDP-N-acetylmuramoyl-tripeptide--D-alanyl-D-alanine ligase
VTLIAPVHLERAGSMENIIRAKTELVEALPAAPEGIAVLNYDDDNVMTMVDHTDARIVTYGLNQGADIWASQIEGLGLNGIRFWIHSHGAFEEHSRRIHLPMLGRHSVHTALRAAAVGLVEEMGWDAITEGLRETQNQLRLIVEKGPNGSMVLDDTYNASPSSTIAALNLLNDIMEGRRIAVLGDMLELGSYEEEGHKRVGRRAAAVADRLVTVGELGRIIGQEAVYGGMPADSVAMVGTAEEAVDVLVGELRSGDALLVKGSRAVGMERIVRALTERAQSGAGEQSA